MERVTKPLMASQGPSFNSYEIWLSLASMRPPGTISPLPEWLSGFLHPEEHKNIRRSSAHLGSPKEGEVNYFLLVLGQVGGQKLKA